MYDTSKAPVTISMNSTEKQSKAYKTAKLANKMAAVVF